MKVKQNSGIVPLILFYIICKRCTMRVLLAPLLLVLFDWSPVKASAEPLDDAQIKDILLGICSMFF